MIPIETPMKPGDYEFGLIEKLGLYTPVVHRILSMLYLGCLTREQALIAMVYHLANHNDELVKLNIERIGMSIPHWQLDVKDK